MKIRIGTRASQLALWQAHFVADELKKSNPDLDIELVKIISKGDKILDAPLAKIGDKGLFTKELDMALLNNDIDIAVHSMKDVPTAIPEGLQITAVPLRGVVEDAFVSNSWNSIDEVPRGGTIASGSLRRRSQLKAMRPDLKIVDIRGNVNTRLNKLDESDWDGMILARAGLERLEMHERIRQIIPTSTIIPAVGQGALAVVTNAANESLNNILSTTLHHEETYRCVFAERQFLRTLEGGCQIPIGCHAIISDGKFTITGFVGDLEGNVWYRETIQALPDNYDTVGKQLADVLIEKGASKILDEIRNEK
ncbi:MAG: hydroxymethylbilane synthase [Calditrichia bacterium]